MVEPHFFDVNTTEWTDHPQFAGIRVKGLEGRATHPAFSIMLVQLAPGSAIPMHIHEIETETAYVMTGEGVLTIEGVETHLKPGMGVTVRPGTQHNVRCTGSVPLEVLAIHSPAVR